MATGDGFPAWAPVTAGHLPGDPASPLWPPTSLAGWGLLGSGPMNGWKISLSAALKSMEKKVEGEKKKLK